MTLPRSYVFKLKQRPAAHNLATMLSYLAQQPSTAVQVMQPLPCELSAPSRAS